MPSFSWSELFPSWYSWEALGVVTGIFSVLLLIFTKQKFTQWMNWPFSIISAAVYTYLFYVWGLYGNFALQPLFLAISVWGAWYWRGQLPRVLHEMKEVPTRFASRDVFAGVTLFGLLLMSIVYPILAHYGDPSPLWDGLIFCVSLSAIYLQLKKYVQSWYLWIVVDLIAIPFHFSQDRGATAVLYFFYLIMCLFGWYTWHKQSKSEYRKRLNDFVVMPIPKATYDLIPEKI